MKVVDDQSCCVAKRFLIRIQLPIHMQSIGLRKMQLITGHKEKPARGTEQSGSNVEVTHKKSWNLGRFGQMIESNFYSKTMICSISFLNLRESDSVFSMFLNLC